MTYEDFLTHFRVDASTRRRDTCRCYCPCHEDKRPSLIISQGRDAGKIVMHCQAGCRNEDILRKVGLSPFDMFEKSEKKDEPWKAYIEGRYGKKIQAVYHYVFICNGLYAFSKIRFQDKSMRYGRITDGRIQEGLNGGRKGNLALYIPQGLKALQRAISEGRPIYIPEGEKDVQTLDKRGYMACTYGSANEWVSEYSKVFRGADVIILADNDMPGKEVAKKIKKDLEGVAKNAKIVLPCPETPKADITDFFNAGHTDVEFLNLLKEKDVTEKVRDDLMETPDSDEVKKIAKILEQMDAVNSYPTNDLGSARLFSEVFKKQSRYNPTIKDWMFFDDSRWKIDRGGMNAYGKCKALADSVRMYAGQAQIPEDKLTLYLKYAATLTSYNFRQKIINDARDINAFSNEEMDADDYTFNCLNCTLDLNTQPPTVKPHNPDDLLSKISGVAYEPEAKCPLWLKTINEIMEDDTERVEYLQKLFGICLTGNTAEEKLFFFYGATSRNGKSTIVETIKGILGDYASNINAESLAVKANKDSRNASPDIAKLAGVRYVIAPEPPKRMMLDNALVKTLTGRDTITARFLNQNEFSFKPKFKLIINTNYLPLISDETVFKSERVQVVPFNRHFKPEEQDKTLQERLVNEYSGILNWMIEGYQKYLREGLTAPDSVNKATSDYERDSDKIELFISECMIESDKNCSASAAYEKYQEWCKDSGYGIENKGNFLQELRAKGLIAVTGTVNGITVRNVIRNYEIDDFTEDDSANKGNPFIQ